MRTLAGPPTQRRGGAQDVRGERRIGPHLAHLAQLGQQPAQGYGQGLAATTVFEVGADELSLAGRQSPAHQIAQLLLGPRTGRAAGAGQDGIGQVLRDGGLEGAQVAAHRVQQLATVRAGGQVLLGRTPLRWRQFPGQVVIQQLFPDPAVHLGPSGNGGGPAAAQLVHGPGQLDARPVGA